MLLENCERVVNADKGDRNIRNVAKASWLPATGKRLEGLEDHNKSKNASADRHSRRPSVARRQCHDPEKGQAVRELTAKAGERQVDSSDGHQEFGCGNDKVPRASSSHPQDRCHAEREAHAGRDDARCRQDERKKENTVELRRAQDDPRQQRLDRCSANQRG